MSRKSKSNRAQIGRLGQAGKPIPFAEELRFFTGFDLPRVSEWVERYRVLGPPAQEKGPLRLERTPYFRELLDMVTNDDVERIVICKSAQVAGTEFALSVIGYYSYVEPCPIMFVLADEDTAVYVNRERIHGMYKHSPELRSIFNEQSALARDVNLLNGATITVGWASSVARLASRPIRIVVLDEVDKPGYNVKTDEGDPISLAIQRTETFYGRKIIIMSTPTVESGNIWRELHSCDVIYDWHVPCPRCGVYQPLVWSPDHTISFRDGVYRADDGTMKPLGGVMWEGGRDAKPAQIEAAGYRCGSCGAVWDTLTKNRAVGLGKMVPRFEPPARIYSVGFCINRLYSLLGVSGDIPKLVREWITAVKSGSQRKIHAFVNNALGEPYRYTASSRNAAEVLALRDDRPAGTVPSVGILALTAGVDVQNDGFYYVIRAWGSGFTSWLVRYGFVDNWEALTNVLFNSTYSDASGKAYGVRLALIDSGGHRTPEVYNYCRRMTPRAYPSKGSGSAMQGKPVRPSRIDSYPDGKPIPGGLRLYHIDVSYYKDMIDSKLRISVADPGAFILHADAGEDYARQLTAETRDESGRWVQIGKQPNHYLDAEVYAMAAASILGIERVGAAVQAAEDHGDDQKPGPAQPEKRRIVRSRWIYG